MKSENLKYIDALRGIAILMVMIHHTAQKGVLPMPHFLSVFLSLGTRGVQLFFIASAFTLFRSYQFRNIIEAHPIRNFYIRRWFRIAPLYYIAMFFYVIVYHYDLPYWLGKQLYITNDNILSNLFFLHGINPYWINSLVPGGWSITVEMFFYAMFPLLFYKIKNANHALIFLNISLVFKLFSQEVLNHIITLRSTYLWREFLFYYFPSQLPVFAMGICMYFLIEKKININELSKKAIGLFLVLLPMQVGLSLDFLYFNHLIFAIIFVLFGWLLSSGYLSFFTNFLFRYVGKISFSLYIVHFMVISWLEYFQLLHFSEQYGVDFILRFLLVLVFSVLISTITYLVIETPFQSFGKKIIKKLS